MKTHWKEKDELEKELDKLDEKLDHISIIVSILLFFTIAILILLFFSYINWI